MDHQTEVMGENVEKTEVIRQNIEDTRTSLADKLQSLEQQVVDTVQDTTNAVTETVDSVKEAVQETVESVKETVQDTVDTVRGTVQNTVAMVKNTFDLRGHVQNYPWAMMGLSLGVGFGTGLLLAGGKKRAPQSAYGAGSGFAAPSAGVPSNGRSEAALQSEGAARGPRRGGLMQSLLQGPLLHLKNIAIGTAIGAVRELVEKNVSGDVGKQLGDWLNDLNEQLGGESIRSPLFRSEDHEHHNGKSGQHDEQEHAASAR